MADAFHSIIAPKNFGVVLYDSGDYITLKVDTEELLALPEEDRQPAVNYINDVKKALENFGAIVLIVREALPEND